MASADIAAANQEVQKQEVGAVVVGRRTSEEDFVNTKRSEA